MDEQNQMQSQNPPLDLSARPSSDSAMPNMPMNSPMVGQAIDHAAKNKGHWALVAVVVVLVVAFFIVFWYVNQIPTNMAPTTVQNVKPARQPNPDQQLSNEIESVDLGNTDTEFQSIDQDLNSL